MLDHIRELQIRLIVCVVLLALACAAGYFLFDPILTWLRSPLHQSLYYTSPTGSFGFVMKISLMVGIAVTIPVLVYQIIMFISPALKETMTRARVYLLTSFSVLLAASGALFGFYAIMPGALHFFGGFQVPGLSALISADSYLNFVTNVLITFMIVFQIPLLMIIIDRIKPINPRQLFKMEKFVILAGVIISVIVPFAMDFVTCLLIAAPIIILYNLSVVIILARHSFTRRMSRNKQQVVSDLEFQINDQILAELSDTIQMAMSRPAVLFQPQLAAHSDVRRVSKMTQQRMAADVAQQLREKKLQERQRLDQLQKKNYKLISGIQ